MTNKEYLLTQSSKEVAEELIRWVVNLDIVCHSTSDNAVVLEMNQDTINELVAWLDEPTIDSCDSEVVQND